jgi:glucose/mannose-6-phosphate isomerase
MGMVDDYLGWTRQIREALRDWGRYRVDGRFRLVVVAGMGGSGIVGDYLARLSDVYGGIPVAVYKSHRPPAYIGFEDLVVVVSYSGNTLETMRFLEGVEKSTRNIVVVSSDGRLEEIAGEKNYLFVRVPPGLVPRLSLPSMLVSILGLLDSSGYTIVPENTVSEALGFLEDRLGDVKRVAGGVADFIYSNKGLTILATHYPYDVLAWRGKNEFNENSKIPVKVEVAPEWMHNDIVGWEAPFENKYSAVLVRDPGDTTGSKLVDYMGGVYRRLGIPVYTVDLVGDGFFAKLLYGSLLLGVASALLAEKRGIDPYGTRSIREYKEHVSEIF